MPSVPNPRLAALAPRAFALKDVGSVRAVCVSAVRPLTLHPIGDRTVVGAGRSAVPAAFLAVAIHVTDLGSLAGAVLQRHRGTSLRQQRRELNKLCPGRLTAYELSGATRPSC